MAKDYTDHVRNGLEKAFRVYKKNNPSGTNFFEEVKKITEAFEKKNKKKESEYPKHKEFFDM